MYNIKYIRLITLTFFLIFLSSICKSETKIAFVEIDKVLKESSSGKSLIKQLSKLDQDNKKYFDEIKKKLSLEKNKINSQKDILSKEEYNKKVANLNKEFENFQNDGKKKINLVQNKKNIAMKEILGVLNIILSEYAEKNQLSFIIDQKNIIIGRADLNVTDEIIKLLNQKLTNVKLNQ